MSLVLLDSVTASNDAYIDLGTSTNWSTAYDTYQVTIRNGEVTSDGASMLFRYLVSDSPQSSAIYQHTGLNLQTDSNASNRVGEGVAYASIQSSVGTGTQEYTNSELVLFNMNSSSYYKYWFNIQTSINQSSVVRGAHVSGVWESTSATNGIRIICNTGNINSGEFKLYGYAK
jgi:hypothetical protein